MSHEYSPDPDATGRIEPWFAVLLASLVPAIASFALPEAFRVVLLALAGVLFTAGCILLYRQSSQTS